MRLRKIPLWLLVLTLVSSCGQIAVWLGRNHGRPERRGKLPGKATSPNPTNAQSGVDTSPTLTCTGVATRRFDIWFGPSPGSMTRVKTLTPTCSYTPSTALLVNHTYQWRVDTWNGYGFTTGTVWRFSTIAGAPSAPTGPTPAAGATGIGRDPTLKVTATGATTAKFFFGSSTCTLQTGGTPCPAVASCQAVPVGVLTSLAQCPLPVGTTADSTTYNWSVQGVNTGGTTESALFSFTTGVSGPPGAVSNRAPTAGATGVSLRATLSWTSTNATNYDIYLGTGSLPSCNPPLLVSNHGSGPFDSYVPAGLLASTSYCWKIVAKNAAGTTTSSILQFTTDTGVRSVLTQADVTYLGCYNINATIAGATFGVTRGFTGRYVAGSLHVIGAAETAVASGTGGSVWEAVVPADFQPGSSTAPGRSFPCTTESVTSVTSYGEITATNWPATPPGNGLWLQGINWDETGGVLYYTYGDFYYSGPNVASIGRATLNYGTATMTVDALGDWQFDTPAYKSVSSCVLPIPSRWLTSLWPALNTAGQRLFAGCGAPVSVIAANDTSMGPSLVAFAPPTTSGTQTGAVKVLNYPFAPNPTSSTDRMTRPDLNETLGIGDDGTYPATKWQGYDAHLPSIQLIDTTYRRAILGLAMYSADEGYYGPGGTLGFADWRHYMFVFDPEDPNFANPTGPGYVSYRPQPSSQWAMQYKDPGGVGPFDYTVNPLAHVTKTITTITTTPCSTPLDASWPCTDDWADALTVTAASHGFLGSTAINGFAIANTTRGQWVNGYGWSQPASGANTLAIATTVSKGGGCPSPVSSTYCPTSDATPGAGAYITPLYLPAIRGAFGPMGMWFDATTRQLHIACGDEASTIYVMVYQIP